MKYTFAKCDITPVMPVKQAGFIQQVEKITAIKDRLYASVFGLEDGEKIILFLSVDSVGMQDTIRQTILSRIKKRYTKPVYLMLSCTHTHFAPDSKDEAYAGQFVNQVAEMFSHLTWKEIGDFRYSFVKERYKGIGTSRLSLHPSEEVWLYVVGLFDGKKRIGNIVIHNCHPTVMNGYTPFFSSEYPGHLRKCMENAYPGEVFLFWQSAAGDISTRFTRTSQSYEAMCGLAEKLFHEVCSLIHAPGETMPVASIGVETVTFPIIHTFEPIDMSDIPEGISDRELETIEIGQRVRTQLAGKMDTLPKETTLTCVSLGKLKVVFCPDELFSEYLKIISSEQAVVVCYSNGYGHYVTPPGFTEITYERFTDTWTDETKETLSSWIEKLTN